MFNHEENVLNFAFKFAGVQLMSGFIGVIAIMQNVFLDSVMAVPFWLFWKVFGIGDKYFRFLPSTYQNISLWQCIGIFICVGLLKLLITSKNINASVKG